MSNFKKFLISLSTLVMAATASAQLYGDQYWVSVFTPNPSFKVLNTTQPNPLWAYTPKCAYSLCTYSIMNGLAAYQFFVTIGSDNNHSCKILVQANHTYGYAPSLNLLSGSTCKGGLTYQQIKNGSGRLSVQIKSN